MATKVGETMEQNCTLLINQPDVPQISQADLMKDLESQVEEKKVAALKSVIIQMLRGEQLPKVLMTVIRFCITSESHELKKLLTLYWEVVDKYEPSGKLRPEMILVCNALRNDLNHPNEYIRGCTLRFLCKIKDAELVEPLIASVKSNLEHRHSYVRRYAVFTVYTIFRNFGEDFFPDADELIEEFLQTETDPGARRNAFLMLFNCSQSRAVAYFAKNADQALKYGDGFQLVVLELTRKVCRADPSQKSRFIKVIFELLHSSSSAVSYEAAWTLVSLSNAPTAVRAAASAYTHLLSSESDNNVKLIILDKLDELKRHHVKVLQELLMDILRALSSPNSDIRRKTLDIAMDLVSPRNINEVVQILKKEVVKTQSKDVDRASANEYRQMLIKAIHTCAVKFPAIADSVVHVLMDFLNGQGALDVVLFVREILETYPNLRESVLLKLVDSLADIKAANVYRVALWILAEFAPDGKMQTEAVDAIYECLGDVPLMDAKQFAEEEKAMREAAAAGNGDSNAFSASAPVASKVSILADGSYATQSALTADGGDQDAQSESDDGTPTLRRMILQNNYLLSASLVACLTKFVFKAMATAGPADEATKALQIKVLLTACQIVQLGRKHSTVIKIDADSLDRISMCIRALLEPELAQELSPIMLTEGRLVLGEMLAHGRAAVEAKEKENETKEPVAQPDSLISFRQLKPKHALGATDLDLDDEQALSLAAGKGTAVPNFAEQLAHVYQLTGFSDPVYAEAQVTVHDYDIVLDILVINRTASTLTNLAVELSTVGDLKLVERPQNFTIGPNDYRKFTTNIKVSSTETGQIFGTIVYDSSTAVGTTVINMNDIHIDIMDYIKPATCTDAAFRNMWAEFEWENKVAVNTSIKDVFEFLDHIVESTNMTCLSPVDDLSRDCDFLAANLYARSIFREDALVNVSVEKVDGKIDGYIRIRAKTQGIALSLGDRITLKQKAKPANKAEQA